MAKLKRFQTNEMIWCLTDEKLSPLVGRIIHPQGQRRGYNVYDYAGAKVFIKTFAEKGMIGRIRSLISPRGKKEFIIAGMLDSLNVPAPSPLGYGTGNNVSAIVETFIEGKTFLESFKDTGDHGPLLVELARFLFFLKQKKVRHDDLHLDNILVSGDRLYLIDLHKVRVRNVFSDYDEIANLKHALGTIYYDLSPGQRVLFFETYRPEPGVKQKIIDSVNELRDTWVRNKMARAFRDTSIVRSEGSRLYIRGKEECGSGKFVENIKNDRKIKVDRHADHIRKIYLRPHRAKTAWKNHVVLEYMRKTITPAAFYWKNDRNAGYIAMEDLTGRGEELDRYLDRNYDAMDTREKNKLIDDLARFLTSAMAWSIVHRDLKACNIFALTRGGFLFLDVEDIRFTRVDPDILKRSFCQLNNTIPKRITTRERTRFFLRIVTGIDISVNKRQLFKEIVAQCLKGEIVYEGVSGLVVDKWEKIT
ncbi:MAG: BUD32 family EKC/KEOPS complex subunit [Syntrophorhabdaceae bacterium]